MEKAKVISLKRVFASAVSNDDFTVKVADTLEEACRLVEVGFKYVTDMDGQKIFRKRK